jgi:addiction module HigA family antidote
MLVPRRAPIHPGEILLEEFLKPQGITQTQLAADIGVPIQRVNLLVRGKRGVTPDTALRLARYFRTSAEVWLNLQQTWDLWHELNGGRAKEIRAIRPLAKVG